MKKLSILTGVAFMFASPGCLKDKGFEDQKYGIQVSSPKAVAFPEASSSPITVGITGLSTDVIIPGPLLTLEEAGKSTSNVTVKLEYDQTLVEDLDLVPLAAGTFSLNATDVVIPAGVQAYGDLKLTLKNTDQLNPDIKYGVGFKIVSADQGYQVAANLKTLVIALSIKNIYDGVYSLKIKTTGWAAYGIADGLTGTYPGEYNLVTASSNSVTGASVARGDNLLPAFTSTLGATGFGATSPRFIFDNATKKLVDVKNIIPDDGRGRTLEINPAVTDSRYDEATKTIYAAFIMKQNGRPNQFFYDTLTYIKSR